MRYRKLTAAGDYSFGASQKDFYRDVPEAVGQAVQTRILLWLGEWFLDTLEGTPFLISVFGKKTKAEADETIQQRVLETQGMVSIEAFESTIDPDTRGMIMTTTINTIYGPTVVDLNNRINY